LERTVNNRTKPFKKFSSSDETLDGSERTFVINKELETLINSDPRQQREGLSRKKA